MAADNCELKWRPLPLLIGVDLESLIIILLDSSEHGLSVSPPTCPYEKRVTPFIPHIETFSTAAAGVLAYVLLHQ